MKWPMFPTPTANGGGAALRSGTALITNNRLAPIETGLSQFELT